MKATILNGGLPGDDRLDELQEILAESLAGYPYEVAAWTLREEPIAFCLGCFECWTKYPGLCRIDDVGRQVTASIINSDLVVFLTPVTFGGYSSELKKALDRSLGLILPFFTRVDGEVHHQPRYKRFPCMLGIGLLPAPDSEQERLFATLLKRNGINMHAPAALAGFVYRRQETEDARAAINHLVLEIGRAQPKGPWRERFGQA